MRGVPYKVPQFQGIFPSPDNTSKTIPLGRLLIIGGVGSFICGRGDCPSGFQLVTLHRQAADVATAV